MAYRRASDYCYEGYTYQKKVPKFDGKGGPEAFWDWKVKVSFLFRRHNFSDAEKEKLATNVFVDDAKIWWTQVQYKRRLRGDPIVTPWDVLMHIMREKFVPNHCMRELWDKFQRMTQGSRSVDEYYEDIEVCKLKLGFEESEEESMSRFFWGLNRNLQRVVDFYSPYNDLEELIYIAKKAERQAIRAKREKQRATIEEEVKDVTPIEVNEVLQENSMEELVKETKVDEILVQQAQLGEEEELTKGSNVDEVLVLDAPLEEDEDLAKEAIVNDVLTQEAPLEEVEEIVKEPIVEDDLVHEASCEKVEESNEDEVLFYETLLDEDEDVVNKSKIDNSLIIVERQVENIEEGEPIIEEQVGDPPSENFHEVVKLLTLLTIEKPLEDKSLLVESHGGASLDFGRESPWLDEKGVAWWGRLPKKRLEERLLDDLRVDWHTLLIAWWGRLPKKRLEESSWMILAKRAHDIGGIGACKMKNQVYCFSCLKMLAEFLLFLAYHCPMHRKERLDNREGKDSRTNPFEEGGNDETQGSLSQELGVFYLVMMMNISLEGMGKEPGGISAKRASIGVNYLFSVPRTDSTSSYWWSYVHVRAGTGPYEG